MTGQSSLFAFLLGFIFPARRTRSGWTIRHLTRLSLVALTFKYSKLRKFVSRNDISCFVKRKMRIFSWIVKGPIYFPWNMILILSSSPHPPPHYHHVISAYGKYDCIVSPILNLYTAPKLRPIFSALISKTHALHTHKTFIQLNSMTVLLDQTNFKSSIATSHLGTSANLP